LHNNNKHHKSYIFDAFCKKILKNESRDWWKKYNNISKHEILFCDLTTSQMDELYDIDQYFHEYVFSVCGKEVVVNDEDIAYAISKLSQLHRDIILLYFYLGFSERLIGEMLNLIRVNVQYHKVRSLKQLESILKGMINNNEKM